MKLITVAILAAGLLTATPTFAFQATFKDMARMNRQSQDRMRDTRDQNSQALQRQQDQMNARRQSRSESQSSDPAPVRPSEVDTKVAPDVGKMIASGDCTGAYNYALAMGALDTAIKAQQICAKPAPTGTPAAK